MKTGTRILNKRTKEKGYIINDSFRCCNNTEELIVYDETNTGLGTDKNDLEIIKGEICTPIPEKCGAGKGADCCIFLTAGAKGFCCERFSEVRDALIFRTMIAKRNPEEPYPECMKFT